MVDWNRVAADTNYRETIVLAAEAQAIVDKERADEVQRTTAQFVCSALLLSTVLCDGFQLGTVPCCCSCHCLAWPSHSASCHERCAMIDFAQVCILFCSLFVQMRRKGIDPNAPADPAANNGRATGGHR